MPASLKGTHKSQWYVSVWEETIGMNTNMIYVTVIPARMFLKNKLNITDMDILEEAERRITSLRTAEAMKKGIRGKFDFNHLKRIHKFLFGDIFDWAGKVRLVNISKGNQFCHVEYIEQQMAEIFERLQSEHYLKEVSSQRELAKGLAYYMGEINAIHPFRDADARVE